jgi:CRP/FNR family transcriptional activator FtrB
MIRDDDIAALRGLAPFSEMAEENLQALVQASYLQRFPATTQLIEEGDRADMLHILLDGVVELYGSFKDREGTLIIMHPVRAFILAAIVQDLPYLMSARTISPARVLMIPAPVAHRLLREDAAFNDAMMRALAEEFRRVLKALKSHKLRDGTERIAAYLLELRHNSADADVVTLPADRKTIATYPGMTRENLSRSLQTVREHGATVRGNEVRFRDVEKLRALARPSRLIDDLDPDPHPKRT